MYAPLPVQESVATTPRRLFSMEEKENSGRSQTAGVADALRTVLIGYSEPTGLLTGRPVWIEGCVSLRTVRRQANRRTIPISIRARLRPAHNPKAPHPRRKQSQAPRGNPIIQYAVK